MAEGVLIASGQPVPQSGKTPQASDLPVPSLDRFRREVAAAGDLAGCGEESVQAGQADYLVARTLGENPMEAGLLGAGVSRRHAVIIQNRNQPVGGEELALGCFPFPVVQAEASEGNPGFQGIGTSLHKM